MANFTTEAAVRLKVQVEDTAAVSTALIEESIDDAHARILLRLDGGVDTESPPPDLVLGETLLAGALLLRALASGEAAGGKQISIGGNRLDTSRRFDALGKQADVLAREAWETLARFLAPVPQRSPADASDTTPVLGETEQE